MQPERSKSRHCTKLIDLVSDSYKVGLSKPLLYEPVPDQPSSMLQNIPVSDRTCIAKSAKIRRGAMKMARSGAFGLAMQRIKAAEFFLNTSTMQRESMCVALQLHKGVESYVHYRNENYEDARVAMTSTIRLMNELQEKFGYHLDARRVHLARNLLRLDACSGNPLEAARAAFKLLNYTVGEDQSWPYPALQSKASACMTMNEAKQHMVFNQVAREVVLIFIHADTDLHSALLAKGETIIQNTGNDGIAGSDIRMTAVRQWLCAKRASLEGQPEDFWSQSATFFRAGCVAPAFWYGAALDTAIACDQDKSTNAQSLYRQIVESAGSWENLSQIKYEVVFRNKQDVGVG